MNETVVENQATPAEATSAAPPAPGPTDPSVADPTIVDPSGAGVTIGGPDMSPVAMFLHADPVVQVVMFLLLAASVWCWAVILEKAVRLIRLRRELKAFERALAAGGSADAGSGGRAGLASRLLAVAAREWRDDDAPGLAESRAERRERIDHAMRAALGDVLRRAEQGITVLATTGSAAPFIGLFGTVWGIMHSFNGIAQTQDTSLAVVAPGIAEALLATAMGLVAAVPAVIAYNKLATAFSGVAQRFGAGIASLSGELARRPAGQALTRAAE